MKVIKFISIFISISIRMAICNINMHQLSIYIILILAFCITRNSSCAVFGERRTQKIFVDFCASIQKSRRIGTTQNLIFKLQS